MKTFTKRWSNLVSRASIHSILIVVVLLVAGARAEAGQSIGLNFIGNSDKWSGLMQPEDKAGVPTAVQTNWNNAANPSGALTGLKDGSGNTTAVDVIWHTAFGTHGINIEDKGDDARMMRGYLDAGPGDARATVTFTEIPYAWYDVIIYFDGDTDDRVRVGAYTVNGVTVYGQDSGDFDGTFTECLQTNVEKVTAGNYVRFTGQVGPNFSVRAEGISAPDEHLRAPINGIQIVEIADPSAFLDPNLENNGAQLVAQP